MDDRIELDSGRAQIERNFTLHPKPILKIRVETPEGENLFAVPQRDRTSLARPVLVPVATQTRPGEWFRDVRGSLNNPFGIGQFWNYGPRVEALPGGYMGILMVDRELPVYVSLLNYHRVLRTQEVSPGQDEVRFIISWADLEASCSTIRMQVVDAETLAPLEGARANLWGGTIFRSEKARSDAQGNLVIEGREPGEFDLRVEVEGHETYRTRILADSGAVTDLGRVALDEAVRLEVRVVDTAGHPTSARFSLGILDPSTRTLSMERNTAYGSSPSGMVELADLGRHVYVLRTDNHDALNDEGQSGPHWVSGNCVIDMRSGSPPVNPTIQLHAATRLVISVPGEAADGLWFRIVDERGLDLVFSRFFGNGPRPLRLPQGTYQVALLDADRRVLSEKTISLGAETARLELSR